MFLLFKSVVWPAIANIYMINEELYYIDYNCLYSYFFTSETFNYFLNLCLFFHLIEFKFNLSFSFSKMCFTTSSLNTN